MHVLGTLTSACRSLADFISELTHKKLLLGAGGLGFAIGASASAAPFLDDFSIDTSANYVSENSYMTGGSFAISGGTLNITTGASNTFTVTTVSALDFAVGESFGLDVPVDSGPEGVFQTLGSTAGQPDPAVDGYRVRRTGGIVSVDNTSLSMPDPNPEGPLILWIDRKPADEFEFFTQIPGAVTRTSYGSHTLALGANLHIGMQAFNTAVDTFAYDNLRIVDTASIGDIDLTLTINRDTGGMTFEGDATSPVTILGYTIQSQIGALDQAGWTSISGNYDASTGGDGSVDPDDEWTVLSAPGDHTNLSEAELDLAGGNGATLAAGASINLSQAGGAWGKHPTEDVSFRVLLSDGTTSDFPVQFTGNGGNPFTPADLDFNNVINEQDWLLFVAGHLQDLSSLSPAEAYAMGDLDGDGDNDVHDFRDFKDAFITVNGAGSFAAMLNSVPEPSSLALLGLGTCLLGRRRAGLLGRRRERTG